MSFFPRNLCFLYLMQFLCDHSGRPVPGFRACIRVGLLLFFSCSFLRAEMKIAVVDANQAAGPAALLEGEFSDLTGVVLLDRANVRQVIHEALLPSTTGGGGSGETRFYGTDALVFVGQTGEPGAPGIRVRVISVRTGLVIHSETIPLNSFDDNAAKNLVGRVMSLGHNLSLSRGQVFGISVVGLEGDSHQLRKLEPLLNELLTDALAEIEGVYILNRRNLTDLQWEKSLLGSGEEFWKASAVLRGNLSKKGEQFSIRLLLTLPGETEPVVFESSGENPYTLSRELAVQVKETLAKADPTRIALPGVEVEAFESRVAEKFKVKAHAEVLNAAESAYALGSRDFEMRCAWVTSQMYLSERGPGGIFTLGGSEGYHYTMGNINTQSLLSTRRALELFSQIPVPSDRRLASKWSNCGEDLLRNVSVLLQETYYQKRPPGIYADQVLLELRKDVRQLVTALMDQSGEKLPHDLLLLIGQYNGFWHDDVQEWEKWLTVFLESLDQKSSGMYRGELENNNLDGNGGAYCPWLVAWTPGQRGEFQKAFDQFLVKLVKSDRLVDNINAVRIKLSHVQRALLESKQRVRTYGPGITPEIAEKHLALNGMTIARYERYDSEVICKLLETYCELLWLARTEYEEGTLDFLQLRLHYHFADSILESMKDQPGFPEAQARYYQLRRDHYAYFAERAERMRFTYFNFYAPAYQNVSGESVRRILEKVSEAHPELKNENTEYIRNLNYNIPENPGAGEAAVKRPAHSLKVDGEFLTGPSEKWSEKGGKS